MKTVLNKQDIPGLVILVIIGLGITMLGAIKIKNAIESKKWPVTTGTVTASSVGGGIKVYPSINYTYKVDSADYSSTRISNMNFSTKDKSVVEKILQKYPVNSEVKVYYDSDDPSKALLEPGTRTGNFLLAAFGILILAIPVFCFMFMKIEKDNHPGYSN